MAVRGGDLGAEDAKRRSRAVTSHRFRPFCLVLTLLMALCGAARAADVTSFERARRLAEAGHYDEAIAILDHDPERLDAESRHLLADCLYLKGDRLGALRVWNTEGRPILDEIAFYVPERIQRGFIADVIGAKPGRLLECDRLQKGTRVLRGLGIPLTAVPVQGSEGRYRLEVTVPESSGPFSSWFHFGLWGAASLASSSTTLPIKNLDGRGASLTMRGRWVHDRRLAEARYAFLTTAPVLIRNTARAAYEERALAASLTPAFTNTLHVQRSRISWESAVPVTASTDLVFGVGRLERWGSAGSARIVSSVFVQPTVGLRLSARGAHSSRITGEALFTYSSSIGHSAPAFSRTEVRAGVEVPIVSRFTMQFDLFAQEVSRDAPTEELVMAGVGRGDENALHLRGHPLFKNGVAGYGPTGLRGVLFQSSVSYRVMKKGPVALWTEVFVDEARLWDRVDADVHGGWITDGGAGLRLSMPGGLSAGIRRGHGFTDRTNVWSIYLTDQF